MPANDLERRGGLAQERVQRRLAAIMAADVVGYSALMERAEEATYAEFERLKREMIEPCLSHHEGRLIKTTGDGALAEFASPLAAIRCAVEIQDRLTSNSSPLRLRVGLNLGDVIVGQDGDLYGDGINIAVRLEGIADPGGILISEKVWSEVEGKLDVGFEDRGEQQLKNISKPVRAYAVRAAADCVLTERLSAPPLPDKPSIAVLPFQNLSDDPGQEFFADGIVEDIITALSRFRSFFVIARNSSFTYKGKAIDIKRVGRELGVRYVLEGSVRKAGVRVRISGQLIDATTGAHLWADRFEGTLRDIFDLQDDITQQVVGAIEPELDRAEIARASRTPLGNADAITELYRGLPHLYRPTTPENNNTALQHFRNAIALEPTLAAAYGCAATCFMWRRVNYWPADVVSDNAELSRLAERVNELGTDDAAALSNLGLALFYTRVNCEGGIEMVDRAIRSNPNFALSYISRGWLRVWDGGSDAAIADFEQAIRFSPRDPLSFALMIGIAHGHFNAGRYDEAALWADKSIQSFPYFLSGLLVATACYVEAGRLDDAQKTKAAVLRLSPGYRVRPAGSGPIRSLEADNRYREALLKAGLPE